MKFKFANFPFERGEILFSKGFFDFRIFVNYKTKAKTSYTLSTRRSLNPLIDRPRKEGYYEIISGHFLWSLFAVAMNEM